MSQASKLPIPEPYRIKSVEPLNITTREERSELIASLDYNLFQLHTSDIYIDLLTDSGTSAMSANQWAAMMTGDEGYAGAESFFRFESAIKNLMPFKHIIPTHQGRAAEAILSGLVGGNGKTTISNTHFDTTRANLEAVGSSVLDFNIEEGLDPTLEHPFKGNMDVARLENILQRAADSVSLVLLTLTNNAGGGQPVALENIRETRAVCEKYGKPLFIDGCRFAENAYFIKTREPGYENTSIPDIVREIFSLADGMTMSAKKDGMANIGGWLALNDDDMATEARNMLMLKEGFYTYGGLAGRDLDAIAVGVNEVVDESYLEHRIAMTRYFGEKLSEAGIPMMKPFGGHAVFVDAKSLFPHIEPINFPGQAFVVAMYELGGVRCSDFGSTMWGKKADGTESVAPMELVRLALPRRVYTQSHYDYVAECAKEVVANRDSYKGFNIKWQPKQLRHFSMKLERM